MDNFIFNPVDGFANTTSYPDPASGGAARDQLQSLHSQTRDFINEQLVTAINAINTSITSLQGAISTINTALGTATSDISDLKAHVTTLEGNLLQLSTDVTNLGTNFSTQNLYLTVEGVTYKITVDNGSVVAEEVV